MYVAARTIIDRGCSNKSLAARGLEAADIRIASRVPVQSTHLDEGTDMKHAFVLAIVAAALGGCAIVPAGYGDYRGGYYQERSYNRGEVYDRDYHRDRDYNYRHNQGDNGDPFQDHGR